ncbi:Lrp/AsnC family transcriptional regulator [Candidatus Bathyarchaeota archaeon]|nr:MAG: Lrp/AsnC family transcriptional regulator [Candidatus Bathyarchaeota archaeon]
MIIFIFCENLKGFLGAFCEAGFSDRLLVLKEQYYLVCHMQISVYILVQVKGEPWRVAAEISKMQGIKTVHTVTGQYDIIVFAELDGLDVLKDIVKEMHKIEGVQHTQTAVCIP